MKRIHKSLLGLVITVIASTQTARGEPSPDQYKYAGTPGELRVLQNRFFKKTWRPEINLGISSLLNDAYTNTRGVQIKVALFPTEWWGIEAAFEKTKVEDSQDRKALRQKKYKDTVTDELVEADVEINAIHNTSEISIISTPFYGKINLLDTAIVYTDVYLLAGLLKVGTDQGTKMGLTGAIGQRVYFTEHLLSFFEIRDRIYKEIRNEIGTTRHTLVLSVGVGFFLL